MEKNYYMVSEASHKQWEFENQTTACVIKLTLNDPDNLKPSEIWMDYGQFEQLMELIKKVNEK